MLLRRMHFENIAWPIIAVAILASIYLTIVDSTLFFHWFYWEDIIFIFSERILVYKFMIMSGLILSLTRVPIVHLKLRSKTEQERLAGKGD